MRQVQISITVLVLSFAATCASAQYPQRIVSLSPNVTEILYGVGAFGRVVGVSDYCTYPPEVKNLPHVGGWIDSNLEKITALHPDLVILAQSQTAFVLDHLKDLGLRTLIVPDRSLADSLMSIEEIGRATGNAAEAEKLVRQTKSSLDHIRSITKPLPRRTVLFVVDRTPGTLRDLYVATGGSFLAELVEIAGGRLVGDVSRTGYVKIGKDAVLTLNPEVVFDMAHGSSGRLGEDSEAIWEELPELRAVRERRVYAIRDELVVHGSQFVAHSAELLASLLHPEAFSKGNSK